MRPLWTLTAHPLAEFTSSYATVAWGQTHRAQGVTFQVGGKGINVARAAQRLGLPARAVYLSGGPLAGACRDWFDQQAFDILPIETARPIRQGCVVRAADRPETTFLGEDTPVAAADWERALGAIAPGAPAWIALCGSIPGWSQAHARVTTTTIHRWQSDGHRVAVDTYGAALQDLAELPVDLLKINAQECLQYFGARAPADIPELLETSLRDRGASAPRAWVVTGGASTTFGRDAAGGIWAIDPPPVEAVSATGSGDVFLASWLHASENGADFAACLHTASAHGAANAADPGVASYPVDALPPGPAARRQQR